MANSARNQATTSLLSGSGVWVNRILGCQGTGSKVWVSALRSYQMVDQSSGRSAVRSVGFYFIEYNGDYYKMFRQITIN